MEVIGEGKNPLGYERIGKLMMKFAVPSIISLVFNSLYNIVDQIFIGQRIGYLGNAATNVIFPLVVMGIALSIMFGDGGAAFISLNLGRGEKQEASKGAGNVIVVSAIIGIVLAVIVLIFLEPLCKLLGATDTILPYALEYGKIIAIGLPFSMFAGSTNSLIRADGRPKLSMLSMVVGALTNIILDPIFIFVFDWGMAGAAWATVIGQVFSAVISIVCVWRFKNIDINRSTLKLKAKIVSKIAALGVSSFITQTAIVVVITTCNILLTKYGAQSIYGADIPLAAHGITMKVNQIVMSVCLGLVAGCQPIMGFNYGAKQYDRVRRTILNCMGISAAIMLVATIIYQASPMSIVRIFGSESALYNQFATKSFRIFLMFTVLNGFQICSGVFFQAIGKPLKAAVVSLTRQIVFIVPAQIILSSIIGVEGVLWSGPVADTMAFILAFTLVARELKLLKNQEFLQRKEVLASE